jgi:hypothetical protein
VLTSLAFTGQGGRALIVLTSLAFTGQGGRALIVLTSLAFTGQRGRALIVLTSLAFTGQGGRALIVLTSLAFTGQGGRALQRHATYACLELSPKSAPLNAEYSGIPRCLPIYACSKDQRAANSSASTVVSRRQISVFPDPRPSCESASVSGTYLTPKRDFSVTVPSSLLSTRMISCCIARWCVFRLVTHKKLDYTEFQGDLDRKNPTRNWSTQKFKGSQTEKASPHKHPQSACTKSGRVDEGTKSIQHTGFTNLRFDTDWNHHSAPWLELLDQRGRDGRSGSTDMDCIVWS